MNIDINTITIIVYVLLGLSALWVILKIVRLIRSMAAFGNQGVVFSEKLWQWEEGDTLTLTDIWPALSEFVTTVQPPHEALTVRPQKLLQGAIEGVEYAAFRVGFSVPTAPKILQARLTFSAKFPGKLVVAHVTGPTIGRDTELESIAFNKQTLIQASTTRVAYEIFSPDFMSWYLTIPTKPLLYFEGNRCVCTFVEDGRGTIDVVQFLTGLLHHIRHSGALQKA